MELLTRDMLPYDDYFSLQEFGHTTQGVPGARPWDMLTKSTLPYFMKEPALRNKSRFLAGIGQFATPGVIPLDLQDYIRLSDPQGQWQRYYAIAFVSPVATKCWYWKYNKFSPNPEYSDPLARALMIMSPPPLMDADYGNRRTYIGISNGRQLTASTGSWNQNFQVTRRVGVNITGDPYTDDDSGNTLEIAAIDPFQI
jgi:hypothetical protein